MRLAAAAPGRERLALAVDWLEGQVRKLNIAIQTGVEVTAEQIGQDPPGAVIVAVGGGPVARPASISIRPRRWSIPATGHARRDAAHAGSAVVLDTLGDQVGMASPSGWPSAAGRWKSSPATCSSASA
jgi:hypothetical protein